MASTRSKLFFEVVLAFIFVSFAGIYVAMLQDRGYAWVLAEPRSAPLELADEWLDPAVRQSTVGGSELLREEAVHLHEGLVAGQETVFIHAATARAFVAPEDGFLYGFDASAPANSEAARLKRLRYVGGRILGGALLQDGTLIACDAARGLLAIDTDNASAPLRILAAASDTDNTPILYCDDVAADEAAGIVYFTDAMAEAPHRSSSGRKKHRWNTLALSVVDLLRGGRGTGRLLAHNLRTGATTTLLGDLKFANGVAIGSSSVGSRTGSGSSSSDSRSAAGADFVLVAETFNARVLRHWVRGPKAGFTEVFALLPAFVDGISRASDGGFWAACPAPADALLTRIADALPPLRSLLLALPESLWPHAQPLGMVVKLDQRGQIQYVLSDEGGKRVSFVTAVTEFDGVLYLGQLLGNSVVAIAAPVPVASNRAGTAAAHGAGHVVRISAAKLDSMHGASASHAPRELGQDEL